MFVCEVCGMFAPIGKVFVHKVSIYWTPFSIHCFWCVFGKIVKMTKDTANGCFIHKFEWVVVTIAETTATPAT